MTNFPSAVEFRDDGVDQRFDLLPGALAVRNEIGHSPGR